MRKSVVCKDWVSLGVAIIYSRFNHVLASYVETEMCMSHDMHTLSFQCCFTKKSFLIDFLLNEFLWFHWPEFLFQNGMLCEMENKKV